jgi:hypothetical protein
MEPNESVLTPRPVSESKSEMIELVLQARWLLIGIPTRML